MIARASVALALLLATALAAPAVALAAPKWAEADQRFRAGVQLYKENDFAAALVEFQRAYDIDPKYQVLYNIAESHYQLQDYAGALATYERYLEEGGAKIPFARRKQVEAEIATLSRRVATITITTDEPGAAVTIDDVGVGTTPVEALVVSAGRRRVTASLPGRTPATRIVDLAGGDRKTIALEIPAAPTSVVITERERPPPPPAAATEEGPSSLPVVVMWSVTGALAVGATVTGIVALGASSDVEDELARFPGDEDALASASSSASGFGLATDVLIAASLVAAGISTYLTIDLVTASDDAPAASTPGPARARVQVLPGRVSLDGTF